MASGFDGLVERLLYDVALAGTGGLGIKELGDAIREFYSSQSTTKGSLQSAEDDDDLLFSETPPDNGPIIDDNFVELVWQWVSRNPEVTVEGKFLPNIAATDPTNGDVETQPAADNQLHSYRKQRLCTGEDRVWYAIAGHGIDYKRIPFLEFQALSVIAAQGTKGVLQPDVTKLTGQDKRSLPKRTDNLAKNGYIVKTSVIARGTKTSLLKLKKFAGDGHVHEDEDALPGTTIIQYNLWFEEMMKLLRENDNIMAFEDVRIGLGINKKRFETRALHRCVRRLARVGCLRRVTAKVEAPASQPDAEMKSVRSLQLLRDPTDIDRIAFMRSDWQRSKLLDSAQVAQFAVTGGVKDDEDDVEDAEAIAGLDGEGEDVRRILHRTPPLWNPDVPFPNFLYNRINEAGITGTSSSELYEDSVGQFWKRAMDEMLIKLTDLWQFSQPPHLRHLAIVKDTCQRGKQPTFQYRTHDNFDKAVVIGDAFWDGVFGPAEKGKGKAKQKKAEAAAAALPDLDDWGFPKPNPKLFVGQSGAATLEECRKNAKPTLKGRTSMATPGSLIGRPPKPGGDRRQSRKSRMSALPPKSQAHIVDSDVETPTHEIVERKPLPSATLKRTAEQAGLDIDRDDVTSEQNLELEKSPAVMRKQTKALQRKSTRPNDEPSMTLPATPRTGTRASKDPVPRDDSPSEELRGQLMEAIGDEDTSPPIQVNSEAEAEAVTAKDPEPTVLGDNSAAVNLTDDSDWRLEPVPYVDVETGVKINPAGSFELKKQSLQSRGRPPKAKIAVFRSSRLRDFPWYVRELPHPDYVSPEELEAQRKAETLAAARLFPQVIQREPLVRRELPVIGRASIPGRASSRERRLDRKQSDEVGASLDTTMADPTAGHSANAPLPSMIVDGASEDKDVVKQYKKAGVTKNIGALHIKRRNVAMDIIRTCGGMFPGKGEIWFPFVTTWQKQYNQTPDKHTVDNVMKGLVKSGKLKKLTFFFKSRKGLTIERSIFVEPEIEPNSPKVKALQKKIIDNYPSTVLPEEADVSPEFRKQAARNPQTTHQAKLARAAGEELEPATTDTPELRELPPHYSRDEFPEDATVTVRRTANGVGLGAIDAQLQSIKRDRKLANLKRREHSRKVLPAGSEEEDGVAELTYEQALLQSQQEPSSYIGSAASKRSTARTRSSAPGRRKLPGRILGTKIKRAASNAGRKPADQTKKGLPWEAIGYVASQAAHSFVNPEWAATVIKTRKPPKRIERVQWKWVDQSAEDWDVQPTALGSDTEMADPRMNESASFGLLLPNNAQLVDSNGLNENADVQLVPQTIADIMNSNILPSSPESGSDQNEATKFFNEVERVQAWEKHVVKSKQALARGADHPFINHTTPADIPWPTDNAPFAKAPSDTPPARSGKRVRINDDAESPKAKRLRRSQTNSIARTQAKAASETEARRFKKRDRRAAANFGEKEHDRLAKAVALVSVVAGGLSYRRNWLIVAHAFGYQFESEFLRHRWDKVREQKDPLIKQMQAQIWEPFLDAYDRGVLPDIDYDDLEGTDWPALMDWLENEVITSTAVDYSKPAALLNRVPDLPMTSEDLESDFVVTESAANMDISREEFFTAIVDKRRKEVATSSLNGLPLESKSISKTAEESNDLLRSWTRAVVLTEEENYDSVEAYKKIRKFGDKVLDSTIRDLCAEKILQVKKKGRRLPGRNLKLDDTAFLPMFKRWPDKERPEHLFLVTVAEMRAKVLETLRHQDYVELAYDADDELYVVLTNMVGQGLLKVKSKIPERNDDFDAPYPKITAWGYSGYNYNVRTFDKTRLRFSIFYEKTDKFTFQHGLKHDVPIPLRPPHRFANEDGDRIPLWVDIHDQLLPRMWEMVFRSVLNLVVYRPGLNAKDIEEAHRSKVWAWEVEMVMMWMEQTGVAERAGGGEEVDGVWKGGWKAGEWWYCALDADVAKWPALSE